jgi:hypothetical protein
LIFFPIDRAVSHPEKIGAIPGILSGGFVLAGLPV